MSVYSTVTLTREEAIKKLMEVWRLPEQMTNKELEDMLFNLIGGEWLPNSPLNNYQIVD